MKLSPRWYQQQAYDKTLEYIAQYPDKHPLIVMPTGCHAKGYLIRMADGTEKAIECVRVGDSVQGVNNQHKIVQDTHTGTQTMYRIVPRKGEAFIVNKDHVLNLYVTKARNESKNRKASVGELARYENISLASYLEKSDTYKHRAKLWRSQVTYRHKDAKLYGKTISPWLIGFLLADGHLSGQTIGATVNDEDEELIIHIKEEVAKIGGYTSCIKRDHRKCQTININHCEVLKYFLQKEKINVTAAFKHIPDVFKLSDRETQIEVLSGLLDGDSHYDGYTYDYISKSEQLIDDIVFICRCLGLAAYKKQCEKSCQNNFTGTYYRCRISGDLTILRNRSIRRIANKRQQIKRVDITGFSIEKVGIGDYYGIELEGDKLYLGADFFVHHNSGKSLLLAMLCSNFVEKGHKVLIVSHVAEILKQDYLALCGLIDPSSVGLYSASLKKKERKQVTVAGVQSICNKAQLFSQYKYIIIDECHRISTKSDSSYHKLFKAIPNATVIGLTATPFRTGTGSLVGTEKALFDDIVFDVPIIRLIKEGYLCGLETNATNNPMDVTGVKTVAGDYSGKDLAEKLDNNAISIDIVDELVTYKDKRKSWLVFAIDIAHCEHITTLLKERDILTGIVHSKLKTIERDATIAAFKRGELQAVVSVSTLTTGFDHPAVDLIAMLRPTKSPVLYIQQVGRSLRVHPSKKNSVILDFSGNINRLGPINDVTIKIKGKKGGQAPIKTCPECNTHVPASAKQCYICGYEFPPPESKLNLKSSNLKVLVDKVTEELPIGWFPVSDVTYSNYMSMKKINSMRVTYTISPNKKIHEYINPFAKTKKGYNDMSWLKFRLGYVPYVETVSDMMQLTTKLDIPATLKVDLSGSYPKILDATFR